MRSDFKRCPSQQLKEFFESLFGRWTKLCQQAFVTLGKTFALLKLEALQSFKGSLYSSGTAN